MKEIACLDHGFVSLVDTMGTDRTPAQTARTSFRNRIERTALEGEQYPTIIAAWETSRT